MTYTITYKRLNNHTFKATKYSLEDVLDFIAVMTKRGYTNFSYTAKEGNRPESIDY